MGVNSVLQCTRVEKYIELSEDRPGQFHMKKALHTTTTPPPSQLTVLHYPGALGLHGSFVIIFTTATIQQCRIKSIRYYWTRKLSLSLSLFSSIFFFFPFSFSSSSSACMSILFVFACNGQYTWEYSTSYLFKTWKHIYK